MANERLVLTNNHMGALTADHYKRADGGYIEITTATEWEGTSYVLNKEQAEKLYEWLKKELGK